MKNLKRVLSLALSGIMLVGMMAVGASAVDAKDFTDAAEIQNKDAVSTMSALNVINGKDTGAFDPKGTVTRAEVAKMLCVAMNGGKDPVLGTKATPTYTDIKGHWAESYIEYCSSLGYISGRGDGTFDPAGNVTSTEAAKIILGALGYKADVSGLTGADWAINTNVIANGADVNLYDGLESIDTTAAMTRDEAALMFYNALGAKMVAHNGSAYVNSTYSENVTVREQTGTQRVYKMELVAGGALASFTELESMKFASAADADAMAKSYAPAAAINTDYTLTQEEEPVYSISNAAQDFDETFGHKFLSLITYSDSTESSGYLVKVTKEANKDTFTVELDNGMTFRKVKTDYSSLMGQKVKVLYKARDNVYGIYAHTDSTVIYEGVVGKISWTAATSTLKVDGTAYKTDAAVGSTMFYGFNDFDTTYGSASSLPADKAANVKVIDNNADGKVDLFVYTPYVAAKVTYKGNDNITLNPAVTGVSSFDLADDVNAYEGIAKNDYVIATPAANTVDGKVALVKAEVVTGTVEAMKANPYTTARVDGTWYELCAQQLSGTDTVSVNDDAELMVKDGYYFYADVNASTTKDLAVAVKVASTANLNDKWETALVLTDGTQLTAYAFDDEETSDKPVLGTLYTYEKDKNGVYELTKATTGNTGYDDEVTGTNFNHSTDKLADGTYIADDAVVIIRHKNTTPGNDGATTVTSTLTALTKTEIITGKTLKGLSASLGDSSYTKGFTEKINGLSYVKVLFLAADKQDMVGGTASSYGYIVSGPYKVKEGSDTFIVFDLWNGEETVTVKDKVNNTQALVAPYVNGTVIEFSDEGEGIVDNVSSTNFKSGAIVGYSASDKIMKIVLADGTYFSADEINSDTEYFYINSADKKGVVSEGVELATETSVPGSYYQNVWALANGTKIAAVFIDVNNKLAGMSEVSEPAVALAKPGTPTTGAALFATLGDGVYSFAAGTTTSDVTDISTTLVNFDTIRFFKFTTSKASTAVKLVVNAADGTPVWEEAGTVSGAGAHFFYIDASASKTGSATTSNALVAGSQYTYQIVDTADNSVLSQGAFTYVATV